MSNVAARHVKSTAPDELGARTLLSAGIIPRRTATRAYLTRLRYRCQRRYLRAMRDGSPETMQAYVAAAVAYEEALDRMLAGR
jgi:hypothetical protein